MSVATLVKNIIVKITNPFLQWHTLSTDCMYWTGRGYHTSWAFLNSLRGGRNGILGLEITEYTCTLMTGLSHFTESSNTTSSCTLRWFCHQWRATARTCRNFGKRNRCTRHGMYVQYVSLYKFPSLTKECPWAVYCPSSPRGWPLFECFCIHPWKSTSICCLHLYIIS